MILIRLWLRLWLFASVLFGCLCVWWWGVCMGRFTEDILVVTFNEIVLIIRCI